MHSGCGVQGFRHDVTSLTIVQRQQAKKAFLLCSHTRSIERDGIITWLGMMSRVFFSPLKNSARGHRWNALIRHSRVNLFMHLICVLESHTHVNEWIRKIDTIDTIDTNSPRYDGRLFNVHFNHSVLTACNTVGRWTARPQFGWEHGYTGLTTIDGRPVHLMEVVRNINRKRVSEM